VAELPIVSTASPVPGEQQSQVASEIQ